MLIQITGRQRVREVIVAENVTGGGWSSEINEQF